MSQAERNIVYHLTCMLNVLEKFEDRHNRRPITKLMRWIFRY